MVVWSLSHEYDMVSHDYKLSHALFDMISGFSWLVSIHSYPSIFVSHDLSQVWFVGWLVGYCPLIPQVTSPSSTSAAADVGLLGGRCCGRREGLTAGLHSAARGGAWQQRGGDWAAPGGEGQPGEDLVGMAFGGVNHGYMMLKHGNKVISFLIYIWSFMLVKYSTVLWSAVPCPYGEL
jgi:hypothetical protein